jgi:hypothetical protein
MCRFSRRAVLPCAHRVLGFFPDGHAPKTVDGKGRKAPENTTARKKGWFSLHRNVSYLLVFRWSVPHPVWSFVPAKPLFSLGLFRSHPRSECLSRGWANRTNARCAREAKAVFHRRSFASERVGVALIDLFFRFLSKCSGNFYRPVQNAFFLFCRVSRFPFFGLSKHRKPSFLRFCSALFLGSDTSRHAHSGGRYVLG